MTPLADTENVHVGPSGFRALADGSQMGAYPHGGHRLRRGADVNLELKLEVWDSPNSAGIVIDAVRCARLALDRGLSGALAAPSSYFMKSPPEQYTDHEARTRLMDFIDGAMDEPADPA